MAIVPKPPGTVSPPTDLTEQAAGSVAIPVNLTEEAAGAVAIPVDLTEEAAGAVAIPVDLTEVAAGSVAVPVDLTEVAAGSVAVPVDLTEVAATVFPRSVSPKLDIDFAADCYAQCGVAITFDDLFTYARNTSASFINRRITCGKAEFFLDTDFVGNVENLALFSEQFDNGAWTQNSATVVANIALTFDGRQAADKIIPSSSGSLRGLDQPITLTTADHTVSFKLKADGFDWVKIIDPDGANGIWFNITIGTIGTSSAGSIGKITPLGDGWYQCDVTAAGAVAGFAQFAIVDADNVNTVTASGSDGVLIDQGQVTLSAKPLPYVKTLSVAVTTAFTESLRKEWDSVTGLPLGGLVEGANTNLALRSEEYDAGVWAKNDVFVTVNGITAPDGTVSADKIIESAIDDFHFISQLITLVATNTYTFSFYAKAIETTTIEAQFTPNADWAGAGNPRVKFDLVSGVILSSSDVISATIKPLFDGWHRCTMTQTIDAVTTPGVAIYHDSISTFLGDGTSGYYLWGAQMELLPIASSYIRAEGSTVSRAADPVTITPSADAPDFGSDISITVEFDLIDLSNSVAAPDSRVVVHLDQSGSDSVISTTSIRTTPADLLKHELNDAQGGALPAVEASVVTRTTLVNLAGVGSSYVDGILKDSFAQGSKRGVVNNIAIGSQFNQTRFLYGHIKTVELYDIALTATEVSLL